jgi:release factor glutamine methyltransferase
VEPIRSHRARGPPPTPAAANPSTGLDPPAVYPPREDTLLLLPFAEIDTETRVIEVCAGTGLAALAAARRGAHVVATDLNPHALRLIRARARIEGVDLAVVRTDLARGLGRFDRLLANPPYLPTVPEERDPDWWHNLALDGGPDGCRVTARLVGDLEQHLTPDGSAFVIVSSLQSPSALAKIRGRWERGGGRVEVADSRDLEGERLEVWRFSLRRRHAVRST